MGVWQASHSSFTHFQWVWFHRNATSRLQQEWCQHTYTFSFSVFHRKPTEGNPTALSKGSLNIEYFQKKTPKKRYGSVMRRWLRQKYIFKSIWMLTKCQMRPKTALFSYSCLHFCLMMMMIKMKSLCVEKIKWCGWETHSIATNSVSEFYLRLCTMSEVRVHDRSNGSNGH